MMNFRYQVSAEYPGHVDPYKLPWCGQHTDRYAASVAAMKWARENWPPENGWIRHDAVYVGADSMADKPDEGKKMGLYRYKVSACMCSGERHELDWEGSHPTRAEAYDAATKFAHAHWPGAEGWRGQRADFVGVGPLAEKEDTQAAKAGSMFLPGSWLKPECVRTVLVLDWTASEAWVESLDDAFKVAGQISEALQKERPVLAVPPGCKLTPLEIPWSGELLPVGVTVPDDRDAEIKRLREGIFKIGQDHGVEGGMTRASVKALLDNAT